MPSPYGEINYTNYRWDSACAGDGLCTYALKCHSCNSSYVLEQGECISRSRCRKYSLYNSTTSGFNSAYCYCKPGFYLTGVTSCSICHWSCKTCTGSANTSCATCHDGTYLSGGVCVSNSTYAYIQKWNGSKPANTATIIWTATMTGNASTPRSSSVTVCDSGSYVFGYYGYTGLVSNFGTATLELACTESSLSTPHYGIHFRAKFLFIDDWEDGKIIVFS